MLVTLIEKLIELPPFSIPATVYEATSPRALVIVLPAMGTAAGYYGPLAEELQSLGFTALLPELPGTGNSLPRPSWTADYGYRDLTDEYFPQIVEHARKLAGGVPVLVIAHSLGAHAATLAVATGKAQVDALVTVACGHIHFRNWDGMGAARVLFVSGLFPALTYLFGHMPGQYFGFGGPQARTLIREWAKVIYSGSFAHVAPDMNYPGGMPALCIGFESDRFSPPRSVAGLAKILNSEVKILQAEGSGNPHSSWARQPKATVQVIADWLLEKKL